MKEICINLFFNNIKLCILIQLNKKKKIKLY